MGRILLVEDEQLLAELLAWVLQQEGHEVLPADSAAEALRQGLSKRPELIVADWMLKDATNGGEVCRQIRAASPATRAIIVTGHPEILSHARACKWVDVVLEKPFHMRHLLKAIRKLLWRDEYAWASLGGLEGLMHGDVCSTYGPTP
jgi:DNA-binding response OmpR family regulator